MTRPAPHVLIAGGGVAAVEAMLALRAFAEERVTIELVSAAPLLRSRPSATAAPFGADEVAAFELAELARRAGASFRRDALTAVIGGPRTPRPAPGPTPPSPAPAPPPGPRRHPPT